MNAVNDGSDVGDVGGADGNGDVIVAMTMSGLLCDTVVRGGVVVADSVCCGAEMSQHEIEMNSADEVGGMITFFVLLVGTGCQVVHEGYRSSHRGHV